MGLCKCAKRKVTNLFCFEHRVNVCEDCMVNNHPRCVVQSYVQWLQDSDYTPICELCRNDLANAADECVRLTCYHVFHWPCLDQYARQLPPNTAPAGYACPTCNQCIFPKSNLVSPVVDNLKTVLSQVNWARVGLGLPLVEEIPPASSRSAPDGSNEDSVKPLELGSSDFPSVSQGRREGDATGITRSPSEWDQIKGHVDQRTMADHSIVDVGQTSSSYPSYLSTVVPAFYSPKRLYDARDVADTGRRDQSFDHDDNKYRRRSAVEWFSRWFKSMSLGSSRNAVADPHRKMKSRVMIGVLVFIGLFTVVLIMWRIGRAGADTDPFLDPNANPNIRVVEDIET